MRTIETFTQAVAVATAVPIAGGADALLVTATLSSGCTLTLLDGSTVAIGNQTLGTVIRIKCAMATFAAGTLVALRA